ncbi:synaptogyrin [Drosophila sulfurigaster albostrigata]|uniref:Synaptogyrin n=1 Tax=Drosophila albomicans TaxID=7291 RepID=A0A6P8WH78_DROAB|nr:synaptogyrin [Drosophila albomicans]XP_060654554.1 synaptogyrin [Drosophila nasuta]XP_062137016.1 synaptogyrin [Drosophila sulfurigaster albostrigata]
MDVLNQILNINAGGAYGGGKAGGAFDPVTFAMKPQVVIRALCWLFSIVVFGCISSEGWVEKDGKEYCLYNNDGMACKFGNTIGVFGFLASMGFIGGEFLFERMSSVKSRKRYVMADMGFSAAWAFFYFIAFFYLWSQWSSAPMPPYGIGAGSMKTAIVFCFFNIFSWALCAFMAYKRFLIGAGDEFTSAFETDPANVVHQQAYSYSMDNDNEQYSASPFGQPQQGMEQQQPGMEYQQPTY